jgi:hypothetical protein
MKFAGLVCAIVGIVAPICCASASYVQFSKSTDSISVAGNTVLPNEGQVTYEAIIQPTSYSTSTSTGESEIYGAWEYGEEDEHFRIDSSGNMEAYAFPVNWPNPLIGGSITLNTWLDLAYVYDGSQERLYINGNLVGSRAAAVTLSGGYGGVTWPTNGDLSLGSGSIVSIGAMDRGGDLDPAFVGNIKSLRISSVGRYSGTSYAAPMGDFADDSSTVLLYDFDQLAPGSSIVPDISGNGHAGTLGAGFSGATSPSIIVVPEPSYIGLLGLFPLLSYRCGKSRNVTPNA